MIVQVADNPSVGNPFVPELPWKGDHSTWIVEKAVKIDEGTLSTRIGKLNAAAWKIVPDKTLILPDSAD
ncbi:hypothetical protein IFM46972_03717 [Aspergillus udagawae]|uniref:Uncharacterized protein n=1 Tax=Aspergillus udagawae TaxID=91492 RepID=A0A8H3NJ66_9EURO|nr:hypothetical protein IFM46972_03717 [Aspergillus udagawae]